MSNAKLDDISEFLNIKHIEAGDCLITVLLFDVIFDVGFKAGEEVRVDLIITEVKDILNGLLHLVDIQRL